MILETDLKTAAETAAAKVSVPVAMAAVSIGGWGVAEWMYTATIVYIAMQAGYLAWKWRREWLASKAFKEKIEAK
jgi:hypothetical protein